jgi:DNA topoisomerase-2
MNNIDDKYPWTTAEDSVREKNWAAGTTKPCDVIDYYYDGTYWRSETKTFSPAWLKLIDEIVVNALDHIVRCLLEYPKNKVSSIKASFDGKRVTVTNDGEGVEVVIHPRATQENGKDTYVPTHIFGTLFNGSNRKKTNDSIIGGTNGVGAKIGSIMSDEFTVITVDSVRKLRFEQTWRDGKRVVEEPKITKCTTKSFTTFTFIPSVHTFGDTSLLTDVVRTRMEYASAYARLCEPKIAISFNDMAVMSNTQTIVKGICGAFPAVTTCVDGKFKWEIAVACAQSQGVASISVVNGIIVRAGSHFTYVTKLIVNEVKTELTKTLDISKVNLNKVFAENFFLLINANTKVHNVMGWSTKRQCYSGYKITEPKTTKAIHERDHCVVSADCRINDTW